MQHLHKRTRQTEGHNSRNHKRAQPRRRHPSIQPLQGCTYSWRDNKSRSALSCRHVNATHRHPRTTVIAITSKRAMRRWAEALKAEPTAFVNAFSCMPPACPWRHKGRGESGRPTIEFRLMSGNQMPEGAAELSDSSTRRDCSLTGELQATRKRDASELMEPPRSPHRNPHNPSRVPRSVNLRCSRVRCPKLRRFLYFLRTRGDDTRMCRRRTPSQPSRATSGHRQLRS